MTLLKKMKIEKLRKSCARCKLLKQLCVLGKAGCSLIGALNNNLNLYKKLISLGYSMDT
jgi:hypothetical protein